MLHQLYAHVVWTTRDRASLIRRPHAAFLATTLPTIATRERATIMEIGIVSNHVHLLMRLHPTTSIPRLLQLLKGGTSAEAAQHRFGGGSLRWAKGYSIHSVGLRALEPAGAYVRQQHRHHPHLAIDGWPEEDA